MSNEALITGVSNGIGIELASILPLKEINRALKKF